MSITNTLNYKAKYIILAIIILLIVITIIYFTFFNSKGPEPPHTDDTNDGKTKKGFTSENDITEKVPPNEKSNIPSIPIKPIEKKSLDKKSSLLNKESKLVREPDTNIDDGNIKNKIINGNETEQKFKIQGQSNEDSTNTSIPDKERNNHYESVTDISLDRFLATDGGKFDVEDFKLFEYSNTPDIIKKLYKYLMELDQDIKSVPETKFHEDLSNCFETDVESALKSFKERKMANQQMQALNYYPIVIISTIVDHETRFRKIIRTINDNYKIVEENAIKPFFYTDFFNIDYFDQITIDEDINITINLKNLKKTQFEDIPFSILIQLEIRLSEMKVECMKYFSDWINRHLVFIKMFCLRYKDLKKREKAENYITHLKLLYDRIQKDISLNYLLTPGNEMEEKMQIELKKMEKILDKLKKLRDSTVSNDSENRWESF